MQIFARQSENGGQTRPLMADEEIWRPKTVCVWNLGPNVSVSATKHVYKPTKSESNMKWRRIHRPAKTSFKRFCFG